MAWTARRDTPFSSRISPVFATCERLEHASQRLPTQTLAQKCRCTLRAHFLGSGEQLAAKHAGYSSSQGGKQGRDTAPNERRLQAGGGVSSRCPYLRTTRPPGRVNCGGSVKRIGGGQARKRGKEGKPVAQRVTTTTA